MKVRILDDVCFQDDDLKEYSFWKHYEIDIDYRIAEKLIAAGKAELITDDEP